MRALRAFGYIDSNSDWRAAPEALRKAVDAYNDAGKDRQVKLIQRIQCEPEMARSIGQLITKTNGRSNCHGIGA